MQNFAALLCLGLGITCNSFGECYAVLVNGGLDAFSNYSIHSEQLEAMYRSLRERGCVNGHIYVLSASGVAGAPDYRENVLDPSAPLTSTDYKFEKGAKVSNLGPATADSISKTFDSLKQQVKPADTVFVYLNDHGDRAVSSSTGLGTSGVVLWGKPEKIYSKDELAKELDKLDPKAKVKLWTDCCFCGTFNSIRRPNTCVATSTDAFHVGDYFWENWDGFVKDPAHVKPHAEERFAAAVKQKNSSLYGAAKSSSLSSDDTAFNGPSNHWDVKNIGPSNCNIGPKNSADSYLLSAINLKQDSQPCFDELSTILFKATEKECNVVGLDPFPELRELQVQMEQIIRKNKGLGDPDINELAKQFEKLGKEVSLEPAFQAIVKIQDEFLKLSSSQRKTRALEFQQQVQKYRKQLLSSDAIQNYTYPIWQSIAEAIFFKTASKTQQDNYKDIKRCLSEPLF